MHTAAAQEASVGSVSPWQRLATRLRQAIGISPGRPDPLAGGPSGLRIRRADIVHRGGVAPMIGIRIAGRGAAVLLATALLAGCSDRTSSPAAGTFTPGTPDVLTVVTTEIPSAGFWEGTPSHLTGGFEYELARLLARRFGLKSVRVKLERFDRVVHGQLDGADLALDLITPTAERARSLSFSAPYLDAAPTVVVRAGTSLPDLASAQDLRWGAVRSTTFVGLINKLIDPDAPVAIYQNTTRLLAALEAHHIDALLLDMPAAVVTAERSGGRLHVEAQLPHSETIAAALPKHSNNAQAVDSAVRAFMADGTIKHLLRTWIGSAAADAERSIPLLHTTR
jgi:ABC-type amino acid transport substrate-binding protein